MTQNIRTCSAWQIKMFLYENITPILKIKILDFNCEKLLTKSYCVHVFFDIQLVKMFGAPKKTRFC